MPPRSASSSPHSRASSSRGRIPAENTSTEASIVDPSDSCTDSVPSAAFSMACVDTLVCTVNPRSVTSRVSRAPPPSSTCRCMSRGLSSTTCGANPMSRSALAASNPSSPPPITTPAEPGDLSAVALIASRSSMVRYTKQPSASPPGTGGTNG